MSDDWLGGDPFADPGDPAARERDQRRREREEKRRQREGKRGGKDAAPPPPEPSPAASGPPAPPQPPRTPEQEFWDEPADAADEPVHDTPESEAPAAAPAQRSWEIHDEGDPALAAGRNGDGPRQPGGRGRGVLGSLRRHPFRIFAVIAALFVLWFGVELFQPFHGDGSGRAEVTIPKGASVSEVGNLLGEKGVIASSTLFQIRVTLAGKRSDLYPGHYTLAHDMSYGAAIDALTESASRKPTITTVTIPEGYSRPQTAQLAREDGLKGNYMKATLHSKYLNPAKYGGKRAKNLEGFLFPDTFEFKPGSPVGNLVQLQLEDFKRRLKGVDMRYARSKNLTTYDVLTLASIIEHEVAVPSQRKLAAAVFYNRLRDGIPLGSDATVRFATGNYAKPLTASQLASSSPYNTRLHAGLPPGPIDSPGLAAIEAAAHPAKANYLYFVTAPGGSCKKLAFAKTQAEFERDVERYEAANCRE